MTEGDSDDSIFINSDVLSSSLWWLDSKRDNKGKGTCTKVRGHLVNTVEC